MSKKHELPFNKIHIAPFEWTIRHDPSWLTGAVADAGLDQLKTDIVVDLSRSEQNLRDDIWHEALHACYQQTPLYKNSEKGHEEEEALVAGLSPRQVALLRDNPDFVRFIMGDRL
jgi:hypothetical protein